MIENKHLKRLIDKEKKKIGLKEKRLTTKKEYINTIYQYLYGFRCSYDNCMISCPMPKNIEIDGKIYPCIASIVRSIKK